MQYIMILQLSHGSKSKNDRSLIEQGRPRQSQSAILFNIERKVSDKFIPGSNKRPREEIEDTSLTLLVNQAATSTIIEKPITVNVN